ENASGSVRGRRLSSQAWVRLTACVGVFISGSEPIKMRACLPDEAADGWRRLNNPARERREQTYRLTASHIGRAKALTKSDENALSAIIR
ncbi:hypothetical protein, partial [Cronobacter malonaticus]|uniref:hypothetical protein n=1 Tax=Cronobacter malonaticus TaxID=413503 RepID=UPI001F3877C1